MSSRIRLAIMCDGDLCGREVYIYGTDGSSPDLAALARRERWLKFNQLHFCPQCQPAARRKHKLQEIS